MDKNLKKAIAIVLGAVLFIILLFIPITKTQRDGGTIVSSAILYKRIQWKVKHAYNNTYTTGEDIYFFPFNFKSYDKYYEPEQTVTFNYEAKPIWMRISDAEGTEAHKITNSELIAAIMDPVNAATFTYVGKADEDVKTITISVSDIERKPIMFDIKDSHTAVLDGYLYESDIELPYELLLEIFENN
ncbi:MAG: hypothetical protein IJW18_03655 [Lachnospiraceae bacterium]|nr:hypothetical protein [Lachnospiraceae bacterium]